MYSILSGGSAITHCARGATLEDTSKHLLVVRSDIIRLMEVRAESSRQKLVVPSTDARAIIGELSTIKIVRKQVGA